MNYMRTLLVLHLVVLTALPTFANQTVSPGKSLWGVKLGVSRQNAVSIATWNLPKAERQPSRSFRGGLVWDGWDIADGGDTTMFEMLSRRGRVIQLRLWFGAESRRPERSFAELLKSYRLQKRVYGIIDPAGSGYVSYYYTDLKRGITYSGGTQDAFLLDSRPDGIVVHRRGVRPLAIESGLQGKLMRGKDTKAYRNAAEAERDNR